jgi:hypothetical protein
MVAGFQKEEGQQLMAEGQGLAVGETERWGSLEQVRRES